MRDKWILDRLFNAGGIDVLWPDVMGMLMEMGFKYSDVNRAMSKVSTIAAMPRQWLRLADHHFAQAEEAERAGHSETAAETYYRAAGCYARARWSSLDPDEKKYVYERIDTSYRNGIRAGRWPVEKVDVPLGDFDVPGLLHLPAAETPVPAVLIYPGMDMTKEYFPVPFNNLFTRRGLAALVIDAPGQGESDHRGIRLSSSNTDEAGRAALTFLRNRPEIDSTKLAVMGIGTSAYSAFSLAASEKSLSAVAGFEGTELYDRRRFIDEVQPAFEASMRRMTGLDGDDFERFLTEMSMEGKESRITAPVLLMMGEWDEHVSVSQGRAFLDRVTSPTQLVVYEGENHVMGNVSPEALNTCADWIVDRLRGEQREPMDEYVYVSEY